MVTLFSYVSGNTVFHTLDVRIKLILMVTCVPLAFSLPLAPCIVLCIAACLALIFAGCTAHELFSQLKFMLYYALIVYGASLLAAVFDGSAADAFADSAIIAQSAGSVIAHVKSAIFYYGSAAVVVFKVAAHKSDVLLVVHLVLAILLTSLLYRTTSPFALREAIEDAERFVLIALGKQAPPRVSQSFSLLLVFIPLVFASWNSVTRAWKARRGKSGISMMLTLLPVFFSVCMKKAHTTARALQNRSI